MNDDSKFDFDILSELEKSGEAIEVYQAGAAQKFTELKVEEVERSPAHGDRFDAFTVLLTGSKDKDQHLEQGTYHLKNPAFGDELVFVTPNAQDSYHICISREVAKSS